MEQEQHRRLEGIEREQIAHRTELKAMCTKVDQLHRIVIGDGANGLAAKVSQISSMMRILVGIGMAVATAAAVPAVMSAF